MARGSSRVVAAVCGWTAFIVTALIVASAMTGPARKYVDAEGVNVMEAQQAPDWMRKTAFAAWTVGLA